MAHVQEEATAKWWRFDDSVVTPMASGPFGELADHGVAKSQQVCTCRPCA